MPAQTAVESVTELVLYYEDRIAELQSRLAMAERDFQESYKSAGKWQGLAVQYQRDLEQAQSRLAQIAKLIEGPWPTPQSEADIDRSFEILISIVTKIQELAAK